MKKELRVNKKNLLEHLDNDNKVSLNSIKRKSSKKEINLILNESGVNYKRIFNSSLEANKICKHNFDDIENNIIKNININKKIKNLQDLIDIINEYPLRNNIKYNINLKTLNKIKPDLIKLNNMIGLNDIKNNIIKQILYYLQGLYNFSEDHRDFMHTVLSGPPGSGKTEVAKIIGNIFSKMGILKENKFRKVTRSDFIAGYLGQTALKTKHLIEESLNGVLFIDEAYALGNPEKRDSFAKEALDTLCESLSNHKDKLMVIIAGYEEELNKCFFSYNEGLESRFIWRYKTLEYSGEELKLIFEKKIREIGWLIEIDQDKLIKWFDENKKRFENGGRSIETLVTKTKISHSVRIFGQDSNFQKQINLEDLENGLDSMNKYENNKDVISLLYT
jgi:AAA+ superfamily predicted ATPase